jgi:hypothetical protein
LAEEQLMKRTISLLFVLLCAKAAQGIIIETVPVGDAGNPRKTTYGHVDYAYDLGKYV